jgi:hypothetical protein
MTASLFYDYSKNVSMGTGDYERRSAGLNISLSR